MLPVAEAERIATRNIHLKRFRSATRLAELVDAKVRTSKDYM